MRIFGEEQFRNFLDQQKRNMSNEILCLKKENLGEENLEILIAAYVEKYELSAIVLHEDSITTESTETKVDVSGDWGRDLEDCHGPVYVNGLEFTFYLPFEGDATLLKYRPSSYAIRFPDLVIMDNNIVFSYSVPSDQQGDIVNSKFESDKKTVIGNLQSLNNDITLFNKALPSFIQGLVSQRKRQLESQENIIQSIKYPMRKKEEIESVFIQPIKKKYVIQEILNNGSKDYSSQTEYLMEENTYKMVLDTIRSMAKVIERSPRAFGEMDEETLRFQFLIPLNGIFEGDASAETFNFKGKTDILVRVKDKNIFIAECKIWKGEVALLETIDQILGYISWRDTKAAIILFVKNNDFTNVLAKIDDSILKHNNFISKKESNNETEFRYDFSQVSDASRKISLTIMAFHVPSI